MTETEKRQKYHRSHVYPLLSQQFIITYFS